MPRIIIGYFVRKRIAYHDRIFGQTYCLASANMAAISASVDMVLQRTGIGLGIVLQRFSIHQMSMCLAPPTTVN